MKRIIIDTKLWKYNGPAAWYFLSTTKEQGAELRSIQKKRIGWGSIPVTVTIGASTWKTSLFPTKEGPYLLPVKASVRKKEGLEDGTNVIAICLVI